MFSKIVLNFLSEYLNLSQNFFQSFISYHVVALNTKINGKLRRSKSIIYLCFLSDGGLYLFKIIYKWGGKQKNYNKKMKMMIEFF